MIDPEKPLDLRALNSIGSSILDAAAIAEGEKCPKCGVHCKLFFGDPDGEYWCAVCQFRKDGIIP